VTCRFRAVNCRIANLFFSVRVRAGGANPVSALNSTSPLPSTEGSDSHRALPKRRCGVACWVFFMAPCVIYGRGCNQFLFFFAPARPLVLPIPHAVYRLLFPFPTAVRDGLAPQYLWAYYLPITLRWFLFRRLVLIFQIKSRRGSSKTRLPLSPIRSVCLMGWLCSFLGGRCLFWYPP